MSQGTLQTQSRVVVYTAIFGKKDNLHTPKVIPQDCDFICFTDQPLSSRVWQVRRIPPPVPDDPTRSARRVKILAHEYLPEYTTSVWVDGNIIIRGNVRDILDDVLTDYPMAVYDHASSRQFPLRSVRESADYLIETAMRGKWQEDPELVRMQMDAYIQEGFPDDGGVLWSCVLFRRHHDPKVQETMTLWWHEVLTRTRRDQMSFNYATWKTGLKFRYIREDAADNPYFRRVSHYLPPRQKVRAYMAGAAKRVRRIFQ